MPRPERPLDPSAGPIQRFAADLRGLRAAAGDPKYLQMSRMTGRSRTALSEAAGGDHLPTWETTEAFVEACGGDPGAWRLKWERVQDSMAPQNSRLAVSALRDVTTDDAGPVDAGVGQREIRPVDQPAAGAEVLLRMWQEQRTQGRQSENHRAIVTIVVAIGAGCGLTYSVLGHHDRNVLAGVAAAVCFAGLFGALMSAKYFERFKMHMDGAQALRRRLDELYPALRLEEDWLTNRVQHEGNYRVLSRIRLEHLWVAAHLTIAAVGLLVATLRLIG